MKISDIPNWKFWDWTSIRRIFSIFFVIIGGGFVFIYGTDWFRSSDLGNLTETTQAIILDVKPLKYVDLTLEGNKMRLHGFEVTYQYKIDTHVFTHTYFTKSKSIALEAQEKMGKHILIKYDPKQPENSSLRLE